MKKTIRCTQKVADLWLAGLRSGKYQQGQYVLWNAPNNTYCCLGVLELVVSGSVEQLCTPSSEWLADHKIEFINVRGRSSLTGPFESVMAPVQAPWVLDEDGNWCDLTDLNDNSGLTFAQIADLIEPMIEIISDEQ